MGKAAKRKQELREAPPLPDMFDFGPHHLVRSTATWPTVTAGTLLREQAATPAVTAGNDAPAAGTPALTAAPPRPLGTGVMYPLQVMPYYSFS